ncbi:MAG: acetylxylan esterase [Planctomycetes bacterium]|nr:acetylxylan esterase [Planctomycetota bacterium]
MRVRLPLAILLALGSPALPALASDVVVIVLHPGSARLALVDSYLSRLDGLEVRRVQADSGLVPARLEGARLVVIEHSIRTRWCTEAKDAIRSALEGGLRLAFWQIDAPAGWDDGYLPGSLVLGDADGARVRAADSCHPLVRDLGDPLPEGSLADAALSHDGSWKDLLASESGAHFLVRTVGKGEVAVLQVRDAISGNYEWATHVAANVLAWALGRPSPGGDPGAALHIEAESFEGPWRLRQNIAGYLGWGARTREDGAPAGATIETAFRIEKEGLHDIWVRAYEGLGEDRRFAVAAGGRTFRPTHAARETGRFTWQLAGECDLAAGQHRLRILDAGSGHEAVDAVRIAPAGTHDPNALWRRPAVLGSEEEGRRAVLGSLLAAEEAARKEKHATGTPEEARRELQRLLALDPWPERTPLGTVLHGSIVREGVKVERVSFESRPGFVVTANAYVPTAGKPPYPAVVSPVGHWPGAKGEGLVQARSLALARAGFIALAYDPAGQGERAVSGNGHDAYFAGVPAGRSNLTYMVWDTIRAIDYLASREDVDPERIACTGASGGGLNTLYAACLDERIRAAVPVVYVCRFREFLETGIWHCPCNHVPGVAARFDHGDLLGMIAPRALLVIAATEDNLFPVAGARAAFEDARAIYRNLGVPERLAYHEAPGGHDYGREMRIAMVDFLRRQIGEGSARDEPDFALLGAEDPALEVFPEGLLAAGRKTMEGENRAAVARALAGAPGWTRQALREWLGWASIPAGELVPREGLLAGGRRWLVRSAGGQGPDLPLVTIESANEGAPWVLVVDSSAGIRGSFDSGVPAALVDAGLSVALADLRGSGDLRLEEHVLATDAILLGTSAAALGARDVARALAALARSGIPKGAPVHLYARGASGGLAVLLAAAALEHPGQVVLDTHLESIEDRWKMIAPSASLALPRFAFRGDLASVRALLALPAEWGGTDGTPDRPPLSVERAARMIAGAK